MESKLKEFTATTARPLPVIVLADISGSMSVDGKIDVLNQAIVEMIQDFSDEDDTHAEIHLGVITFGGDEAKLHRPIAGSKEMHWDPMQASGRTPMGAAIRLATELIEDKGQVPSRAYRPTLVLVSDGIPTDDWKTPLGELSDSSRASKAQRFALGIGEDADADMLSEFLGDSNVKVFQANEARQMKQFFKWVTMSVTTRSRSASPDSELAVEPPDLDEYDI